MTQTPTRTARSRAATVRRGVWRVAQALATPLVPADYLEVIDPLRFGADLRGRVIAVHPETADAATIVIRPGRDWAGHVPGQYVRVGVDIDGVRHWRAYSVTSPRSGARTRIEGADGSARFVEHGPDTISITVKAIPDGLVSTFMVRQLTPGTTIHLDQAKGDFVLPQDAQATRKVLFITGGSGITPVMGMLRNHTLGAGGQLPDVVLLHSSPTAADVVFAGELAGLAEQERVRLRTRHTDTEGMLDLAELDALVPDWRERAAYVCGPTGLLDAAEAHWDAHQIAERLTVERFRPSITVAGEGGEVTFTRSDVAVDADGATPILDAGEDAGVLMPSGCRMGICFGCVATLRSGAVRDLRTGETTAVEDADDDGLSIQTCISAAAGPCAIDL